MECKNFIEVQNLSKIYKLKDSKNEFIVANDDINISFHKGKIIGIFGENGAGKTTLIRLIAGIIKPTSGKILIDNIKTTSKNFPKEIIGYMPQRSYSFWDLTIQEILYRSCHLKGYSKERCNEETKRFIENYNLGNWSKNLFHTLSGGLQRITIFGIAVIGDPALIILDEPNAGLDINKVEKIKKYIITKKMVGTTFLIVSHNPNFLKSVCDLIYVMQSGHLDSFKWVN